MAEDWRKEFESIVPGEHLVDEPMSRHTSFRIGGPADIISTPRDFDALCRALNFLSENNIPYLVVGGGCNLLVADDGFHGAVLKVHDSGEIEIDSASGNVTISGGAVLRRLVMACAECGLGGVENLAGIPGSVGGAIFMNAGAYGSCIADALASATIATRHGLQTMSHDELEFGYRSSLLQRRPELVAVQATLKLSPGDPEALKKKTAEIVATRNGKHPTNVPSAGSFFRNTRGLPPAGKLIEVAGLKGTSVGGAEVSHKHANFLVNTGGATCADVLELMHIVQEAVEKFHGIRLEPEVRIVRGA